MAQHRMRPDATGASLARKWTTWSLPLARSKARMTPFGQVSPATPPLASGPSSAYHTTVGVTNPGLLPRPVLNVPPPPTGTICTFGFDWSVRSVPASHRPSDELVGVNQRSDLSTVAPPAGVHCISVPDPAAQTKRSLATQVPPAAASPCVPIAIFSPRSVTEKIRTL